MEISNEQFDQAYSKLPYPIREFLASAELGDIAQKVGSQHGLHVDTIGALEREATNMLLGLIKPEQFVTELKYAGVPTENINQVTQELNQQIFVPLRKKMQEAATEQEEVVSRDVEEVKSTPLTVPTPPPAPASVIPPVPAPAPVATGVVPPPYTPPAVPTATIPLYSNPPAQVRTMAQDIVNAQEPHIVHPAPPVAPQPIPQRPSPSSSENKEALYNVMKEYGVDPYRESPE